MTGGADLRISLSSLREQFAYAVPLGVSGIVGLLAYETDRLVVSALYSPADFAVYTVGAVEIPVVTVIGSAVSSVLIPRFSRHFAAGEVAQIVETWRESIRKTSLLVMPIFAFLMVVAEPFILLFYGDGYTGSVEIFRVYLLMLPLRVASYGMVLQAIGRSRPVLRGSVYYLLVNIVLNLALIWPLGLVGPALATVIATVLLAGYLLLHVRSELVAPVSSLIPWQPVLRATLVAALAAAVCAPTLLLDTANVLRLSIAALVYVAAFIVLALVSKALTRDDVDLLRRWCSGKAFRTGHAELDG